MHLNFELTAAPHLPMTLRPFADQPVAADFALMLGGDLVVIDETGALRLLSCPNIDE